MGSILCDGAKTTVHCYHVFNNCLKLIRNLNGIMIMVDESGIIHFLRELHLLIEYALE